MTRAPLAPLSAEAVQPRRTRRVGCGLVHRHGTRVLPSGPATIRPGWSWPPRATCTDQTPCAEPGCRRRPSFRGVCAAAPPRPRNPVPHRAVQPAAARQPEADRVGPPVTADARQQMGGWHRLEVSDATCATDRVPSLPAPFENNQTPLVCVRTRPEAQVAPEKSLPARSPLAGCPLGSWPPIRSAGAARTSGRRDICKG